MTAHPTGKRIFCDSCLFVFTAMSCKCTLNFMDKKQNFPAMALAFKETIMSQH